MIVMIITKMMKMKTKTQQQQKDYHVVEKIALLMNKSNDEKKK